MYLFFPCGIYFSSIIWKTKTKSLFKVILSIYFFPLTLCVCSVAKSCLTLCDHPRDRSPPGFSVHAILQARILEWVAISCSRRSSWPRDLTHVSWVSQVPLTIKLIKLGAKWILPDPWGSCVYISISSTKSWVGLFNGKLREIETIFCPMLSITLLQNWRAYSFSPHLLMCSRKCTVQLWQSKENHH